MHLFRSGCCIERDSVFFLKVSEKHFKEYSNDAEMIFDYSNCVSKTRGQYTSD